MSVEPGKQDKRYIELLKTIIRESENSITYYEKKLSEPKKELFDILDTCILLEEKHLIVTSFFDDYKKDCLKNQEAGTNDILKYIDIPKIPPHKVATIACFLADYLPASYKQILFDPTHMEYATKNFMVQTNMNTARNDLDFSVRVLHTIELTDILTLGDLIVAYKENPAFLCQYHSFGRKSQQEVINFFKQYKLMF